MNVVLVSFSTLPTLQNYLYYAYGHLLEMGLNVYTVGADEIQANVEIGERNITVSVPSSPLPTLSSLKVMIQKIDIISEQIEALNPDIVHFVSKHTWNYMLIRKLKNRTSAKLIHTFHDPIGHKGDLVRYGVILYYKVIGSIVDGVVVHSDNCYKETIEKLKPKAEVFHAPLGCTKWHAYREPKQILKKLLIFGRINPYKGCDLVPAIAREIEKRDSEINIIIAGKASKDVKAKTLDAIAKCPNIKFYNSFVSEDELDQYFYNCDVVLITHTSITQSGVILDAYSHSKPIVAFQIDGIQEFLWDTEWSVRAFDISAYAQKVYQLVSDIHTLRLQSKLSWEFGKNHFASEKMAESLFKIYTTNQID
ncbi:glycosyltransferase family 4 protein [Desulforamulus aquiferis]|uniref:Glycosyltransferase n=1 Tax=Desulforamulus aquiferis TaxID=1397668 RepID=A0AAW7ZC05_9FIRM|nr:glycosyltransferase [Desulforamulus aquiferis]MDO7786866.1 glycosyltransferase [Desulforamulus aquiferis]